MIIFRILGSVTFYSQERIVDLGSRAKVRGLLGILLLHANTPVPIDSIVGRLWDKPGDSRDGVKGREPPANPPKALQGYVSMLRTVLEQNHRETDLVREPHGYRLKVDKRLVDYFQFRELAATGRRAFRGGDHANAASILSKATSLWQGRPFANVKSSWTEATAADLIRLDLLPVYYNLFAAQLELGQAEQVLDKSRLLLETHGIDETLIEMHMRALAEVNGPSSVAGYFPGAKQRLLDVGVDPTERLMQVYRRLIEQSARPEPSTQLARSRPGRREPVFFQVPRDPGHFLGRENILGELDKRLLGARPNAIVTLDGGPGIGKTTIVTHWTHRRRDRFPDGVLYADLDGYGASQPMAPAAVLEAFLTALGAPMHQLPGDLLSRTYLLQQELADRRMLIILDNAYDSAHVRPLLNAITTCSCLITSRQKLTMLAMHDGAYNITVPMLTSDESIELLDDSISRTRDRQDIATLRELADLCAGLPLALRIVGEYAATWAEVPLPELIQHYHRHLLDAGAHGDRGATTLRVAFDSSVDRLPAELARFFVLLGIYPAREITTEVAAAVTGLSIDDTTRAFEDLHGAHLVQPAPAGSYQIHDLVHLYAGDRARRLPQHTQELAMRRMVDWYLYTGLNMARLISPQSPTVAPLHEPIMITPREFADADDARRWFFAERLKIIAVSESAIESRMHSRVFRLVATFGELLTIYCEPESILDIHRQAVASARIDAARWEESALLNNLGVIEFRRGRYEIAAEYYAEALAIFKELDYEYGECACLYNLGNAYLERGETRSAINYYNSSLQLSERIGEQAGQAFIYFGLGAAHHRNDHLNQAAEYYRRSLDLHVANGNLDRQTLALTKLGQLSLDRGDPETAVTYGVQACAIGRQIFDDRKTGDALLMVARARLTIRDFAGAAHTAEEAASLCRATSNPAEEAAATDLSAQAQQAMGHYELAYAAWQLALALYEKIGSDRATHARESIRRLEELIDTLPTQRAPLPGTRTWPTPTPQQPGPGPTSTAEGRDARYRAQDA
jgi:DNA-binding SARP family transcriptional activator/tetratricopeptide (TPR) repeat protein